MPWCGKASCCSGCNVNVRGTEGAHRHPAVALQTRLSVVETVIFTRPFHQDSNSSVPQPVTPRGVVCPRQNMVNGIRELRSITRKFGTLRPQSSPDGRSLSSDRDNIVCGRSSMHWEPQTAHHNGDDFEGAGDVHESWNNGAGSVMARDRTAADQPHAASTDVIRST